MKEVYVKNREKFANLMENNSVLVLFAGVASVERGKRLHDFFPQRNLLYLTGIDAPAIAIMMKKNAKGEVHTRLYLERYCDFVAKWEGAVLQSDAAAEISGVENFAFVDELEGHLVAAIVRERAAKIYLDMENYSFDTPSTPDLVLAGKMREKFPAVAQENAHPIFGKLRGVKEAYEIENIRKAVNITKEAFDAILTNVKPGMKEYELEAYADYTFKKHGSRRAYGVIMAAGANATCLHYHHNNCEIKDGDLILLDFGAGYNWYASDITRTFPANGKFTPRQRELYDIVLGALKTVTAALKPGLKFTEINEITKSYYKEHLTRIGLIKDETEIYKYFYHGTSHMLGLEVHDVGAGSSAAAAADTVLAPGMVLTVEPGLYIAEEGIGIRIEDDILITENGTENLSINIPREADDIEKFMAAR